MARPLRPQVAGGIYHVVTRGNDGMAIYNDEWSCATWIRLVERVIERLGWEVLAYCLMPNHSHLVVRTPNPDLGRGMQRINGDFARRYNDRHGRTGHLYDDRYFSALITDDLYLRTVLRYVALNPVKADLSDVASAWRWSSAAAALAQDRSGIVNVDAMFNLLDEDRGRAVRGYGELLGDQIPASNGNGHSDSLGQVLLAHLLADGHSDEALRRAQQDHCYTLAEIAAAIDCHLSTVRRRIVRAARQPKVSSAADRVRTQRGDDTWLNPRTPI